MWYLDGVSSDGHAGFVIGFFCDAVGASKGGFCIEVHALWRDGDANEY